ncbi:MAG TPA: hypothetical protein VIJ28_00985 [Chloroflexota bacterium]|jgi:hypothetical protein
MSKAPGDVAKAFLDALPTLDFNKLVGEARREVGIAVVGSPEATQQLIQLLRGSGAIPADVKLALWAHDPGTKAPLPVGKTEMVIVLPASEAHLAQAKEAFPGVAQLPILVGEEDRPGGVVNPVVLKVLDADQFRGVLLPALLTRLWDRRLALGRALPGMREQIAGRMMSKAARDLKVVLGSVAGAGSERSGVPTPATAQLLLHQAVLVVGLAAVYGISLDDKAQIFRQVASKLTPTVLLDGVEAGLTRLAAAAGKKSKFGKLYGPLTAYVARPTLSAGSTLLAGVVARRVFRGTAAPGRLSVALARTRSLGKKALSNAGQGLDAVSGALGSNQGGADHPAPSENARAAAEDGSAGGDTAGT